MAKAKRKNAFSCFVEEFRRRMRINASFPDVMRLANGPWSKLSQDEKDRYKKMADDYNKSDERARAPAPPKKKKKPVPVPVPNRAPTIKEAKKREEKQFIENLVDKMTTNELINHVFYLIHVNYFCKTSDEEYVPAEIAISRFTLKEGVTDVFHRILNPGVTPLGYSYTIIEHTEKTHRIPLDFVKATKGYLGMYKGITDFLQLKNDPKKTSHLYTMFDEPFHNCSMSAVKYSLKRIWETSNMDDDDDDEDLDEDEKYEKVFKVMSLPILFFFLKNKCAATYDDNMVAFENTSEANIEILNDKYEFTEELACQFHQEIDNVRYCSQSYTVRWAQVIREQCLKYIQSEDEDEYEEEHEQLHQETDEIKLKREQAIKEEKRMKEEKRIKENASLKHELRPIKSERDIKKEKDEHRIKREKEDKNYAWKHEKGEYEIKREKDEKNREIKKEKIKYEKEPPRHRPIKLERDFDDTPRRDRDGRSSEERRIKKERDEYHRRYDDDRVKSERDDRYRRYDDDRIKKERDDRHRRYYDDDRIKIERDDRHRRYDDDRIKSERDDRHRRYYDDDRVKKERDDRYRRYDDDRVKSERDYDSILKTEHVDIPFDMKTERVDGEESSRFHDSHSRRDSLRSDSSYGIKIDHDDIPSKIKTEREDIPTKIKTERQDSRDDFLLKMEHLDIPFDFEDGMSFEVVDSAEISSDASSSYENSHDSELRNKSKTPRWDAHTGKFPMPIPLKTEKRDNDGSDFPLPIPIKVEKDRSDERRSNRTYQGDDDDFPMPIKIKIEKDAPSDQRRSRNAPPEDDDFPRPIKIEKDSHPRPSRSAEQDDRRDFPMPIKVKVEKESHVCAELDDNCDFPRPIKVEKEDSQVQPSRIAEQSDRPDYPRPIKVENDLQTRPSRSAEQNDRPDYPRPIKIEKDPHIRPSGSAEQSDLPDYPRPIKVEKDPHVGPSGSAEQNVRPDYPRPIKLEKDPHVAPSRSTEQNDRPDYPRPIKLEKDPHVAPSRSTEPNDWPDYPRPIKLEKDPHVRPSRSSEQNDLADFSRSIKVEKDSQIRQSSNAQRDNCDDLPRAIKTEKDRCEFPRPIPIKMENPDRIPFPLPIPIKAERPECSRIAERTQNYNLPPSVNIKIEKDVRIKEEPSSSKGSSFRNRKRTGEFIDLSQDETYQNDLGSNSAKIKKDAEIDTESVSNFTYGKSRIKNEPVDSYLSHGIKNEEFNINPEDFDIEPMVPDDFHNSRAVNTEGEIKKEKR